MAKAREPGTPPFRAVPLEDVRKARGESRLAVSRSKVATLRAFRRIRADRLFGLLGVALVVAATILIFTWEKEVPKEALVSLTWQEDTFVLPTQNETLTESQRSKVFTFTLDAKNVTRVHLNVFWIDDVAIDAVDLDNLSVKVEGPPGTNASLERKWVHGTLGAGANLTFAIRVQDLPQTPSQFSVATVEEAARLLGDRTTENGTGQWKVTVTLNAANDHYANDLARAGGTCPAGSPPEVCIPDDGNWVRVSFEYRAYRPEFKPV